MKQLESGSYLLPVFLPAFRAESGGNMVRVVTEDDGQVIYVRPEVLIPAYVLKEENRHA